MSKLQAVLKKVNNSYDNLLKIFITQLENSEQHNRDLRKEIIRQEEVIRGLTNYIASIKFKDDK